MSAIEKILYSAKGPRARLLGYLNLSGVLTLLACGAFADDHGKPDEVEKAVRSMAAVGYAFGGSFSPDGSRVAFVSGSSGSPQVWLVNADGSALSQLTHLEGQVRDSAFSPTSDRIAVEVAPGGGLNTQIFITDSAGAEPEMITSGGNSNNWLVEWSDDGRLISFSSNKAAAGRMDCYLFDTETRETRLIAQNNGIGNCVISPDSSKAVAWRMVSRGDTNLYLVDLASGEEQLLTPHNGVAISRGATFVDDSTLLIASNVGRERMALARIDIGSDGTAGPMEFIAGRDDAELAGMELLADQRLALNWNAAGRSELGFYELTTGELTTGTPLPAEIVGGFNTSLDGQQLLMTASGPASPQNVWRMSMSDLSLNQLSRSAHDGVDLQALIRPELVTYQAHDGLELSGWLYRPAGSDKPGPMVLSFHGGPEGQSRPSFRSTFQALLSRGISVFDPNVRGSSGFGKTFVNLDNGALRFDGVKDIESTVKFVVDAQLADPDRIGIMGGSYGGYMVMAGLTDYPDMFAAGANLFGVVNFATFFAQTEPWMAAISTIEYGDPVKDKELLEALSPIHKVDQVKAPTIVLHGANDTNVPVVEAEQVVDSLKNRDVPVKYVLFPDEGHGWRKTENRITSDVAIVRWFDEYLN